MATAYVLAVLAAVVEMDVDEAAVAVNVRSTDGVAYWLAEAVAEEMRVALTLSDSPPLAACMLAASVLALEAAQDKEVDR